MACKRWCGSSMRIVSRARHEVKQPHSHEGQTSLEAEPRDLQTYMYMAAAPRPTSSLRVEAVMRSYNNMKLSPGDETHSCIRCDLRGRAPKHKSPCEIAIGVIHC